MTHTLDNGLLRLQVTAQLGASVVNLLAHLDGAWEPLLRRTTPEACARALESRSASGLASFTLAPYSNRVAGARFTYKGREYRMRPTTPDGNSQHGDVRNRAHAVVSETAERAEYCFDSREVPDFNYPFPVTLRTVFTLQGWTVRQELQLTNVGAGPMPAGLGLHPYFERHVSGAPDVELGFQAGGYYRTGEELLPSGPAQPIPDGLNFTSGRPVAQQQLNTLYGAYGGLAVLRYPGVPGRLEVRSDPVFSHLVVFTPPDGSVAVEPVTHATDAFNLHARGVPGVGFVELQPGESLGGSVSFTWVP